MNKNNLNINDIFIYIFMATFSIIILYPIYYTVIISISSLEDIIQSRGLLVFPNKVSFSSYKMIFTMTKIGQGFLVTTFITGVGVFLNMFISATGSYALSKKYLPGQTIILMLILLTMLFDPGLIPYYLNIKRLGLISSILVMILPLGVNAFFFFILLNYFRTVPLSLEESARIDGANDILIFYRIVVPISKPVLMAMTLFYAVNRWNEWWHGLIFVSNQNLFPLQLQLRQILRSIDSTLLDRVSVALSQNFYLPSVRMAAVVISTVPIMCIYPFLQKYFTKGILLGSVKG